MRPHASLALCLILTTCALLSACTDEAGGTTQEPLADTSSSGADTSSSGADTSSSGSDTSSSSGSDAADTSTEDTSTEDTNDTSTEDTDTTAPTCADLIRNGDETDVDCGGLNCGACGIGQACTDTADCAEGACVDGVCTCPAGGCEPPPSCLDGGVTCDPNATCIPSRIDAFCLCNDGYEGDGLTCADLDECAAPDAPTCGPNSQCENTEGGYTCACDDGYRADASGACVDTDECLSGLIDCGPNSHCENTPGAYTCACDDGFVPSANGACVSPLDCAAGPAACGANATCTPTPDGDRCLCDPGYAGDGATCDDVDECLFTRCAANSACVNLPGSFECRCNTGYTRDPSGACVDIDECADLDGLRCHPSATCTNTDGGYDCACGAGLFGDGETCAAASCLGHYTLGARASGVFTIDPDGDGPNAPFDAVCDMVTAGGGWTSLNHGPGLAALDLTTLPFSAMALSSLDRFWVLSPAPDAAYTLEPAMYSASAPDPSQTGWLWNATHWPNPAGCHTAQQVHLVADPSIFPRSQGNPHYNAGQSMPPAIAAAALPTTDLLGAAPAAAFPSIHLGCVGWNVLQDPIIWVR